MIDFLNTAFTMFNTEIKWYGILISLAVVLSLYLAIKMFKWRGYDADLPYELVLYVLPLAIIGARLYYIIFSGVPNWTLLEIVNIRSGGLAIYGGIIGGVVGIALFSLVKKFNIIKLLDVAAVCVIIGQCIGRWGNFFNQEAFGAEVTNPNLQFFPIAVQILAEGNAWHYATFFYESMWCLVGFILLISLYKRKVPLGVTTCTYLVFYGIGRALIEGLRTDSLYIGDMRVSQVLSVILILAGIIGLIFIMYKNKRGKQNG